MDGTMIIMDYSSYERQKMRHIIEKTGSFNVIEVTSNNQFKLLDLDIDDLKLVLMDLAFPSESDGFEALSRIRSSENKNVPIIVLTRSDRYELKKEAQKYFVNDYIIKPYQVKRLESSLKSFVRVVRNFHYDTTQIQEIRMSFDDYVAREIKYAKRTQNPLSFILITTLQLPAASPAEPQKTTVDRASIFAIAAQKARESLRTTDLIIMNHDRDVIIILPCTDEDGARQVSDKIRGLMDAELEKMNTTPDEYIYPVYVTYPKDGDSFQMLMETAFKKISDKEMLERIISIPSDTRKYADRSYNKYRKWF